MLHPLAVAPTSMMITSVGFRDDANDGFGGERTDCVVIVALVIFPVGGVIVIFRAPAVVVAAVMLAVVDVAVPIVYLFGLLSMAVTTDGGADELGPFVSIGA